MLMEKTGPFQVVVLLEKDDSRDKDYLLYHAYKALKLDINTGFSSEMVCYKQNGRDLIFMKLRPCEKLFRFDSSDALIDAARLLSRLNGEYELYSDGDKVYIKSNKFLNILSEYGEGCDEKPNLRRIGASEDF